MLHGVAVCCSVLQCVAVWHSVLKCVAVRMQQQEESAEQCVAVCCSVLQYVAVCCSVSQCGTVCCSVLRRRCSSRYVRCHTKSIGVSHLSVETLLTSYLDYRGTSVNLKLHLIFEELHLIFEEFSFFQSAD